MLDISHKIKTLRIAEATALIKCKPSSIRLIRQNKIPKGNPLEVAKVAAIQAAKNTSSIIPYCHPLPIDFVGVVFKIAASSIVIAVSVKTIYKTGVEMEALTAASVAALTIYDMMKMLDETMEIQSIRLVKKTGGKSDFKTKFRKPLRAAVLVMSDSVSIRLKKDLSGKLIVDRLKKEKLNVIDYKIVSDDKEKIVSTLIYYADNDKVDLIMTTGGTGIGPRDCTPEAMQAVCDKGLPGIAETIRAYGQERMPFTMLSRCKAGIRGKTLIVNFPGSKSAVQESLNALFPALLHVFAMMHNEPHGNNQI